jgi:hypothetical protein
VLKHRLQRRRIPGDVRRIVRKIRQRQQLDELAEDLAFMRNTPFPHLRVHIDGEENRENGQEG